MGVTDFDTKVAVVVRDDLAAWQPLNVTAFLISGVTAAAGAGIVGEPYRDADGEVYLPLLRQPRARVRRLGSEAGHGCPSATPERIRNVSRSPLGFRSD
jgi:hypothetical protein